MRISFIDLTPYGYVGKSLDDGGYIYCPYMPFHHETDDQLADCIKRLQEEYDQKNNTDDL